MNKKTRLLITNLIFAALFFLVFAWIMQLYINSKTEGIFMGDSPSFLKHAKWFYSNLIMHINRPYGYAMVIGIPHLFNATDNFVVNWVFSIQFIAWIFTHVMIFKTLSILTNHLIPAFFGTFFFTFCIGNIALATSVMTGTLFTLSFSIFTFYLIKFFMESDPNDLARAFLLLCVCTIIRATLFHLIPVFFIALLVIYFKRKFFSIKSGTFIAIGIIIILTPMIQHKNRYGVFVYSMLGSKAIYEYLLTRTISIQIGNPKEGMIKKARSQILSKTIVEKGYREADKMVKTEFKYYLTQHFKSFLLAYITNLWKNTYTSSSDLAWIKNYKKTLLFGFLDYKLSIISKYQNLSLSLIMFFGFPLFIVFRFNSLTLSQNMCFFVLWIFGQYIALVSGITFWTGARLHMVFYPQTIMGICFGAHILIKEHPIYLNLEEKLESALSKTT